MAYIGRNPAIGTQKVLDSLESQFNGSLTTFDLRYNTNTIYPPIASALIVSLGGVLQEPGVAYTVASDTITFASAPPTGTDCWILLYTEFGGIAGATANLTVSNNLTIGNELHGPANFVIDPATIGDNTGTVEIKGNLTVQGTQTTVNSTTVDLDHLSLGDDEIANFGDSDDLKIYHNSSNGNSIIQEIGSGDLNILGNNVNIRNQAGNEDIAKFVQDGGVKLYYDDYKKFETTNTGVTVTGTVAADGLSLGDDEIANFGTDNDIQIVHESSGNKSVIKRTTTGDLYIQGASGSWIHIEALPGESSIKAAANGTVQLFYDNSKKLETTSAGITLTSDSDLSTAGPEFKLYRDSASPADADYLGQIKFAGESDTGVERNYAKITGKILDASNGTEDGIIEFAHIKAGSQTITGRWRSDSLQLLNSTQLTVNGSVTFDSTLTVADDVVIGGTTAVGKLTLAGDGKDIVFGRTQNSGTGGVGRLVATGNIVYLQAGANASSGSAADLVFGNYGGVGERLRIDSDGRLLAGGAVAANAWAGGDDLIIGNTTSGTRSGITLVSGSNTDGGLYWSDGNSGTTLFQGQLVYNHSNSRMQFYTAGTPRVTIDDSGRLLIGRTTALASSSERLTVDSGMAMFRNSTTNAAAVYIRNEDTTASTRQPYIFFTDGGGNRGGFGVQYDESSLWISGQGGIAFRTTGSAPSTTERFRITSDGKVSISSDGTADGLLTIKGNSDATTTPSIRLLDGTDTREVSISNTAGDFVATTHGTDNNPHGQIKIFESGIILFSNGGASSSFTERLRIDTDGDLLQTWRQDAFIGQKYQYNSTTYYGGLEIDMGSSRSLGIVARSDDTRADIFFKTGLSTTATEKMRITYAGKVGIGHDSAGQITKELTIRPANDGGIRFIRPGATGNSPMSHLDITTTTSGQTFPNGEAYTVKYYTNNNDQIFSTREAGGTGGNISFETNSDGSTSTFHKRLVITHDGNIGVGTASPNAKFNVKGHGNSGGVGLLTEDAQGNNVFWTLDGGRVGVHYYPFVVNRDNTDSIPSNTYFYVYSGSPFIVKNDGKVGIGTETPAYNLEVNGSFAATTKSFIIDHPTKPGMKLRHGSLEGPENGVYVRGRSHLEVINLPDYWTGLVDPDSITVTLTPIGPSGAPRVERIENNKVYVFSEDSRSLDYFYMINAERVDVDPLEVEIPE